MEISIFINILQLIVIVIGVYYTKSILKRLTFVAERKVELEENLKIYRKELNKILSNGIYFNDNGLTSLRDYTEEFLEYLEIYNASLDVLGDFNFEDERQRREDKKEEGD